MKLNTLYILSALIFFFIFLLFFFYIYVDFFCLLAVNAYFVRTFITQVSYNVVYIVRCKCSYECQCIDVDIFNSSLVKTCGADFSINKHLS